MPKFIKGPYHIDFDASEDREGYIPITSRPGAWHAFAKVIKTGPSSESDGRVKATARLFLQSPSMFDFLVRHVVEHGKRGGLYDQLLPAAQQPSEVSRAMAIIAEIEGKPL
ncbi:hypothetical protein [Bosea massiliensis]|uniref:Uncharacterized protein n=1 Tax=Bosea massiliensis TaxID=151419 RepID=A0ABW0PBX1_9HYPH